MAVVPGAGFRNSRKESKRLRSPEVRNSLGVQYNKIRKTGGLFPSVPSKQVEAEAFQLGGNNGIFPANTESSRAGTNSCRNHNKALVGNHNCPVPRCRNNGGDGYRLLAKHIQSSHSKELIGEGKIKKDILKLLEEMNVVFCNECKRIKALASDKGVCLRCLKEKMARTEASKVKQDINENEVKELIQKIEQVNRTKMGVLDYKPKGLSLKWSQVVTSTLMVWKNAKTKKETLLAIEKWHKLKCVIIKPARGGNKKADRCIR